MGMSPEFAKAFIKAQSQVEGAKKGRSNPAFKSKYADLAACWDACEDALQKNGFGIIQWPVKARQAGHVGLATILLHESGETSGQTFEMPVKDPTNPQAVGSALTYARRYALCAVMGICPEDDDGNAAAKTTKSPEPISHSYVAQCVGVAAKGLEEARKLYKETQTNTDLNEATRQAALSAIAPYTKETK